MDEYSFLIGAPPDEANQKILADMLRRRRSFGELGMITGDRVLAPFGQGLTKQADTYATLAQETRQKDIDNRQTKAYQDAQIKHMGNVLKETIRNNNMDFTAQMAGIKAGLEEAGIRAGSKTGRKLTSKDRNDLKDAAVSVYGLKKMLDGFKDQYGRVEVGPFGLPGARSLSNAMAARGYGTDSALEAQQWWAESDRLYNLFERNRLFGATLTPREMSAWAQANANKDMTGPQIREMLGRILEKAQAELESNRDYFIEADYDPREIDAITQMGIGAATFEPVSEYRPPGQGESIMFNNRAQDFRFGMDAIRSEIMRINEELREMGAE
jgi:hypothetical protein